MHAAPKKEIKMPEQPAKIDEVTDVLSDSSSNSRHLERTRQSLPIKSIRDTALSNFNTFKALNKSSSIRPIQSGYKTHAFIHLTQRNIGIPSISLNDESLDDLSPVKQGSLPNTARNHPVTRG